MGVVQKIIYAALLMGGLGITFGLILALVERRFRVETDPRVDQVEEVLPGLNCGACGQAGCRGAAEAIVAGAEVGLCPVGGAKVAAIIGELLGRAAQSGPVKKAVIRCRPDLKNPPIYQGIETCLGYQTLIGAAQGCAYGCIGLGDCVAVCPVGAISRDEEGRMQVNEELCTGCGLCVKACPRSVIALREEGEDLQLFCLNPGKGKEVLAVCNSGCIACGLCVKACPHGAIKLEGNLPVINYDLCQNCGACVRKCPKSCLEIKEYVAEKVS
ncbi:MAG: RnfABCDGE type electron transport complex subunit B [Firmicutes bacterium]|nr:RnfABCDGE type electron transport complex subunit B [Bacillota bacterium]